MTVYTPMYPEMLVKATPTLTVQLPATPVGETPDVVLLWEVDNPYFFYVGRHALDFLCDEARQAIYDALDAYDEETLYDDPS